MVPDDKKNVYKKYGLDRTWLGIVQKSEMFVIDEAGVVAFAQGHGSPWALPSVDEVLEVVKGLHPGD